MSNFYNTYRPKLFADVVGQSQATMILQKQSERGNFGHSYLFIGASGTGKTTTARILAARLTCLNPQGAEPCGVCQSCTMAQQNEHWDILEVNSANFRGIEDIRSLCYKAYLAPFGPRKVFILDEVHMLTKEAVNCLLKLLEEPPPTLTLILCTSEPDSLPETLTSRCMTFQFNKLSAECIKQKLEYICKKIGIEADPRHLQFIAETSMGNIRKAETTLEQVCALAVK